MLNRNSFLFCLLMTALIFCLIPVNADSAGKEELIVAAAASLTDVLTDLAKKFETIHPDIKILFNFGATGALQTQIEQGAPVDVFVGASITNLEALAKKGFLEQGAFQILCRNSLVMVVKSGIKLQEVKSFSSLAFPAIKRIAIGDPAYVPAGKYAMSLLKKLGLDSVLQSKLISASDVRQALAWVETGEVDAALIYETDAKISGKVVIIDRAGPDLVDIHYGLAILKRTSRQQTAQIFVDFITGITGKNSFQKYGFLI